MSTGNGASVISTGKVNMTNRKFLIIAIVLMLFAIVVAPVAAELPTENPLPKGTGWNNVWELLLNLQNQITALTTEVHNIPAGPPGPAGADGADGADGAPGPAGTVPHFGDWQYHSALGGPFCYYAETDGFVVMHFFQNPPYDTLSISGVETVNSDCNIVTDPAPGGDFRYLIKQEIVTADLKGGFTMPIQKGHYWGIFSTRPNTMIWAQWLPLSS
jgi:hypothetical protein